LTVFYRRGGAGVSKHWAKKKPQGRPRVRQRGGGARYPMGLCAPPLAEGLRGWGFRGQPRGGRPRRPPAPLLFQRRAGPHQPLARWRSQLAPLIAERQAAHVGAAKRLTGRLFAEKSKAFRQRLASLWEHRAQGRD